MMKKILVIDDDDFVLDYVEGILEDYYTVIKTKDPRVGLQKYKEVCPDLIILDLVMPVMDGYEVIKEIQTDVNNPPIIVLTGAPDELKEKLTYFNIKALVTKPFKNNEFLKKVRSALGDM